MNKTKLISLLLSLFFIFTPPVFSAPKSFTFYELKALAEEVGFSPSISSTIAAIGLAESAGNPRAHNDNLNTADNSYGLMQINMIDFPYYQLGNSRRREFGIESNEELFDPQVNMKAAKRIYDTSGLTAWSVYRHGTYKRYLR
jgi:hypothetical protein